MPQRRTTRTRSARSSLARTPALSRTAYLLTGDAHLAEDLVQTALFKAAQSWHRIQGDPEPYVRRILYTQNISWWRSRKHVREHQLGDVRRARARTVTPTCGSASSRPWPG